MDTTHLFIHSSVDRQLGCLPLLAVVNTVAVYVYVGVYVFHKSGGAMVGHLVTMARFGMRTCQNLFQSPCSGYSI